MTQQINKTNLETYNDLAQEHLNLAQRPTSLGADAHQNMVLENLLKAIKVLTRMALHQDEPDLDKLLPRPLTPLILANLTAEDERHFHGAHITYSGSTGQCKDPDTSYPGGFAPYIATYLAALPAAIEAMKWRHVTVQYDQGQWIARRHR